MMKLKNFVAVGISCAFLTCTMAQAEAGFNWGGIANKVANKAADSILSGGSKKKTESNAEKAKQKKADAAVNKNARTQQKNASSNNQAGEYVPTAFYGELDPLPPDAFEERPAWFDKRTDIYVMTNTRLVAEYENIEKWRTYAKKSGIGWVEPDMCRHDELIEEIHHRITAIHRYDNNVDAGWMDMASESAQDGTYQRAVASNIDPLRKYGLELKTSAAALPGYHPERN